MFSVMRRLLTAAVAVFALTAAMMVATSAVPRPVHADGTGGCDAVVETRNGQTICEIYGSKGGGGGGGNGDGTNIVCKSDGTLVWNGVSYQCDIGIWSFSNGCYITPVVPQPATDDPIWGSSDPSTNRAQWEDCPPYNPPTMNGAVEIIGPCVGYCGGQNPVERITNELQINKPDLGMAPPGGAEKVGFVNQNIWFWSKALDTSTQTRSAGNVVGTRTFVSADWQIKLGGQDAPGTPLHCTSDNEYTPDKGTAASPDPKCGFQFTAPGTYTISVSTTWTLVISQNGAPGPPQTITSQPNTTTILITEGQSTNG